MNKNAHPVFEKMPRGSADGDAEQRDLAGEPIYQSLYDAIVSHAVPPGTKLTAEVIAEAFNVSRTVVRPVLQALAADGVVTITPRRGAHVTRPLISEAREVFAARRIIEVSILSEWNGEADPKMMAILDAHMHAEREARRTDDQKALLRLSGEFHLRIASISGNATLVDILRDLVTKSVLATAVYQKSSGASCRTDHHQTIVDLIRRGEKKSKLIRAMIKHITEIETGLDFDSFERPPIDLRSVLIHLNK